MGTGPLSGREVVDRFFDHVTVEVLAAFMQWAEKQSDSRFVLAALAVVMDALEGEEAGQVIDRGLAQAAAYRVAEAAQRWPAGTLAEMIATVFDMIAESWALSGSGGGVESEGR
jgi:hypothetical protein